MLHELIVLAHRERIRELEHQLRELESQILNPAHRPVATERMSVT